MQNTFDVIIMGSGPAGCTAGIYVSRANLDVAIFEGVQPGGQLTITNDIENFPGFPAGISGLEIMELMKKQAVRFGTKVINDTIISIDFNVRPFVIETKSGVVYNSKAIIIATGAAAKTLGIASEKTYLGAGISLCATCDGFFYKNKRVFVVGGGDTALEDALYLSNLAAKVTIVHRRQQFRASQIVLDRAKNNSKIDFMLDCVVEEFLGEKQNNTNVLTSVKIRNVLTNDILEHKIDGVFLAIGNTPNTSLFKGVLDLNTEGYLLTKNNSSLTNIEGVFACGDVQDSVYRQAIVAAGSGCRAGIDAERWITNSR